jgi:hypothetical protein
LLVEGRKTKESTYEDVPCTVLELPGAPPALQPSWCRIGGALHVAESPLSLRAFLKARAEAGDKGGDAMDVGDAPLPKGAATWCRASTCAATSSSSTQHFHKVWLPLLKLVRGARPGATAARREGDAVARRRAAAPRQEPRRAAPRRQGPSGCSSSAPSAASEAAALAMVWGPLLSGLFHSDWTIEQVESANRKHQLQTVWAALETFQKDNKRWPNDLAELFADKKLPVDALLMPGDGKAEVVALPAGDTRTVKASFRYFKDGVEVNVNGNRQKMLLIGIAPRRYGRPMLGVDGSIPEVWGEDSTRVIQSFVK